MPSDTSPLQRWILDSQQELLRRLAAVEAAKNSHRLQAGSLMAR
jgi:hypothetical protein